MKYFVVRVHSESGMPFPVINELGDVDFFDTEEEANIERIYLQPDYEELLNVRQTKLILK